MKALIYHHLGIGDHIICNGLVNHLSDAHDKIQLLCKTSYVESVRFLYRNNPKVTIMGVPDDAAAAKFFESFSGKKIRLGFDYLKKSGLLFDEAFYSQAGIPFVERWDRFSLGRDLIAEQALFTTYKVQQQKYVFLHEDIDKGFVLNRRYIVDTSLPVVSPIPDLTKNIFDYCYLIENAAEIHCMDSSFKLLADSLRPTSDSLYHHLYVRGRDRLHVSTSRWHWKKVYYRNSIIDTWMRFARPRYAGL